MAFGQLFGFVGVLIALPTSAVLLVAIRRAKAGYFKSALYLDASTPYTVARPEVNPEDAT